MLTRRQALLGLGLGLFAATTQTACDVSDSTRDAQKRGAPKGTLDGAAAGFTDNVDALFDLIIPAERDAVGNLISPGAREAKPDGILSIDRFAALASALGFLPPLSEATLRGFAELGGAFRVAINANLDALAFVERPLTPFRDLPRESQEAVVARAFDDERQRPAMLVLRAAAFFAWLGAITSDVGLRAVGFPPFEDFAAGIAVSGYPMGGEDYTFNEEPKATTDDLDGVLDAYGDLV